jgi:hypothetical protein
MAPFRGMACKKTCPVCAVDPDARTAIDRSLATYGTRPTWRTLGESRGLTVYQLHQHRHGQAIPLPGTLPAEQPVEAESAGEGQQGAEEPPCDDEGEEPSRALGLPSDSAERAVLIRRFIATSQADERWVERFAVTLGLPIGQIRRLSVLAARLAKADQIPLDLLRDEALNVYRRTLRKAEDDNDHRSVVACQTALDRLTGVAKSSTGARPAPDPEAMPRDEVVGLLQRCARALAPFPEAAATFRTVVEQHFTADP